MELFDLDAHLDAQLGIEIGKRFIKEEHVGLAHDGTTHGDALALAARELAGAAIEIIGEAENGGGLVYAALTLRLGQAGDL